ncbi:MAG: extracellular solute-binding protein [Treponema sp.]|nr:extracellular solute-binding protein [Treponema sp.]
MKQISSKMYIAFFLAVVLIFAGLSSCKKAGSAASLSTNDVAAELTLMMWSGNDVFYRDLGNQNLTPDDLLSQNVAAAYATAKEFKKLYPNVKINIFAKSGDPDDDNGSWEQHRENFRMEYGIYPDIYAAMDMIGDIQRGLIADLSIFADDPMYKSFNPQVMGIMNVEGRQFGLPQYLLPWGIFINKSLAEANNIDVPDPDWNIAEFTRFVAHSRANEYYGIMGDYAVDGYLITTGTRDFTYQLINRKPGEPFVNINSDAVRNLLRYYSQWTNHAIWPNNDQGRVATEFMDENWWWSYKFFLEGKLLVNTGDPWMMGDAAHPNPNHWGAIRASDWDIYPRPSTDYVGNNVGIVLDPFVIRNYAMDDGNPALSNEEKAKLTIAWEFAKFWCGDSRAWEARARQQFLDGETYKSCLNDSFPMVTGPEFQRQMDIWYIPEIHQRFKDRNKMPGFHKVLELWESGQFWDISDKAYPWFYNFEGTRREIAYEWLNAYSADVTGAERFAPNWLDQVYARLPAWNTAMNQRWETEIQILQAGLNRYYPK